MNSGIPKICLLLVIDVTKSRSKCKYLLYQMEFFKSDAANQPSPGSLQCIINLKIYIRTYDDTKLYLLTSPKCTLAKVNSAIVESSSDSLDLILSKLKNIYKLRQQGIPAECNLGWLLLANPRFIDLL